MSRPELATRALAAVSLGIATWVLVLSAVYYTQPFFVRAATPPEAGRDEIERLSCIEAAIEANVEAGTSVRLQIENDDVYLRQRVTELMYPRVGLVADGDAPVVFVSVTGAVVDGATVCGDVSISVRRPR